jgi:Transglycosylase SLT domain
VTTWRKGLGTTSPYTSQITAAIPSYCPSCPPALVLALVQQESGGQQFNASGAPLTGSSGDTGLFQLLPSTAAGLNVDPTTAAGNIQGGLTLLQQLYNQYGGNWTQILEAYNEGPTNLANQVAAGQTPASAGYASSILAAAGLSPSTSTSSTATIDTSDSSDSSDDFSNLVSDLGISDSGDTSSDSDDPLGALSVGGLPGAVTLGIGVAVLGLVWWMSK